MNILQKFTKNGRLEFPWWLWLTQGGFVVILGILFSVASLLKTDVTILAVKGFSWLPILGMLIFILGVFDCVDALLSKEICDFMQRINAGVLDIVFSTLLIFGVSDTPERMSIMVALYLLTRSILRAVFAMKLKIPHLKSNLVASTISFILGLMIWLEWPTNEGWFLSFGLSVNLVFRGLLMVFIGFFIKSQIARTAES